VPGVHRLIDLGLGLADPAATAAVDGSSVGQMLALAHDVDASTVPRRLAWGAAPSGRDDATRSLLETVLRGEEAYVDQLTTGLEWGRRETSLLRHAGARRPGERRPLL
jgi:hypothetical protein